MPSGVKACGVIVPDRVPVDLLVRCARHLLTEGASQRERGADAPLEVLEADRGVAPDDVRGRALVVGRLRGAPFLGLDLPGEAQDDDEARGEALSALAETVARASDDVAVAWWTLADGGEGVAAYRGEAALYEDEHPGEGAPDAGRPPADRPLGRVLAGLGRAAADEVTPPTTTSVPLDAAGAGPTSGRRRPTWAAVERLAAALPRRPRRAARRRPPPRRRPTSARRSCS
ncbi:MAG: hypothetical protein KF878_04440 [Planctomycetes bacterium]|nr:hypothetical protein [Planctomycetota bacterium]